MSEPEEWRDVVGFVGYQVSSIGRVRSVGRKIELKRLGRQRLKSVPERALKLAISNCGYVRVRLCIGNKRKSLSVHRLVAQAFLGDPPTQHHHCAHLNGNRTDNRACNLIWATQAENEAHKHAHGSIWRGERSGSSKLKMSDVLQIRSRLQSGEPPKSIAADFSLHVEHVRKIGRRQAWAHLADSGVSP